MTQRIDKVILVGHCGADTGSLEWFVEDAMKLPVEAANSTSKLQKLMTPSSLLMINRVLEGDFPTDEGVELIGALTRIGNAPKMMLISNYPDAQAAAVKLGGIPGFGKSMIGDEKTQKYLQSLL
jgi:hypothetical protein